MTAPKLRISDSATPEPDRTAARGAVVRTLGAGTNKSAIQSENPFGTLLGEDAASLSAAAPALLAPFFVRGGLLGALILAQALAPPVALRNGEPWTRDEA